MRLPKRLKNIIDSDNGYLIIEASIVLPVVIILLLFFCRWQYSFLLSDYLYQKAESCAIFYSDQEEIDEVKVRESYLKDFEKNPLIQNEHLAVDVEVTEKHIKMNVNYWLPIFSFQGISINKKVMSIRW